MKKIRRRSMKNCLFDLVCYHCDNLNLVEWEDITLYCNICYKKDKQDENCVKADVECGECEYFVELSCFEENRNEYQKKMRKRVAILVPDR